jgi:hypothetical protein
MEKFNIEASYAIAVRSIAPIDRFDKEYQAYAPDGALNSTH